MDEETRSRSSKSAGIESKDRELIENNCGKVGMRKDSGRREPLALLDRQQGGQSKNEAPRRDIEHSARGPASGGSVGEHIGKELRSFYDDIVAQPVPDRFLELLKELEAGAIYGKEGS